MIFAAGLGTRLGALGRDTPKALIEVAGVTMLERTARALVAAGADRIVVNVHHQAERIAQFVAARDLGAEILLSHEPGQPLETGGGLRHARALFRRDAPILLHNVDVICDADLRALVAEHVRRDALATLVVHERESTRMLLFDDAGLLGREDRRKGERREVRPPHGDVRALAFAGIHACSPRLLDLLDDRAVFAIVDTYLRLAGEGHTIAPWLPAGDRWLEIGSAERLEAVRALLEGRPSS